MVSARKWLPKLSSKPANDRPIDAKTEGAPLLPGPVTPKPQFRDSLKREAETFRGRVWRVLTRPACLEFLWQSTCFEGDPDEDIIVERYLEAALETFIFTVAVSWLITWQFLPSIIGRNLLDDIVGYNNVCVGFDMPPARYFAVPFLVLTSYLVIRYCMLDSTRANQLYKLGQVSQTKLQISRWANVIFSVCVLFWPMLLVVTPDVSATIHTNMFLFIMILPITLSTAANFVEADNIMVGSYVWLAIYLVCGVGLITCGVLDFANYDKYACYKGADPKWDGDLNNPPSAQTVLLPSSTPYCKQPPFVPWYITATCDYGWFTCVFFAPIFLPVAPVLKVDYETGVDEA